MTYKPRLTATERHVQIVDAALTAFSTGGYAGTTTDQVARLAGVSQPYVIRLFGSKQQLFIATVQRASSRVVQLFNEAAATAPELASLAAAYSELLAEHRLITVLLHGFAAGADPVIGPVVRDCFGEIYSTVRATTGASADEARDFMAAGMLLTVLGAMKVLGPDAAAPAPWSTELLAGYSAVVKAGSL